MSLIAEALRKAASDPSGSTFRKPRWFYGIAFILFVALGFGLVTQSHKEPSATKMEKPQAAKVSSEKIGLELSRTAEKRWQLSGTIRGGHGKPIALLNNSVVAEGETIGGMKVVQVREDEVDLEADGRIETVEIR